MKVNGYREREGQEQGQGEGEKEREGEGDEESGDEGQKLSRQRSKESKERGVSVDGRRVQTTEKGRFFR